MKFDDHKTYTCPGCGIVYSGAVMNELEGKECPDCHEFDWDEFLENESA